MINYFKEDILLSISEKYRALRGDVLFHYTHEKNIESIKQCNWMIYSSTKIIENGIIPAYITDINSRSIDSRKGYNNYVFLVFTTSHPMIYRKEQEGVPMGCFSIDVSILDIPGVKIADRVATDNSVSLYTPEQALEALDIVNSHDNIRKFTDEWYNVRSYEILIPSYIDFQKYTHRS